MQDDNDLDGLFALAARDRPLPSSALMDRVLADALAAQPQQPPEARSGPAPVRLGFLARLAALFGGGPVLAGVCSVAVVGVAMGYLDPASMETLTGGLTGAVTWTETGTETLDLFPSAEFLTNEG